MPRLPAFANLLGELAELSPKLIGNGLNVLRRCRLRARSLASVLGSRLRFSVFCFRGRIGRRPDLLDAACGKRLVADHRLLPPDDSRYEKPTDNRDQRQARKNDPASKQPGRDAFGCGVDLRIRVPGHRRFRRFAG